MKISALIASGLFVVLVLLASSCLDGLPSFSHKRHVQEQGLACEDCHAGSEDGSMAGVPDPEICAACHEEAAKNIELARKYTEKWPRLKSLPPDGIFAHNNHKEADISCDKCHGDMSKNKKVTLNNMPAEEDCLNCHIETGISAECSTCHRQISRSVAPPDHGQSWERAHGESAHDPVRSDRCFRCHVRSTCDSCHKIDKPLDHTASWREFGHGAMSQFDRGRCETCHRSDSCIRCHRESVPRSHRAGWGPPSDRHCLDCHLSGGEESCYVCHGARITHSTAPRMPIGPVHSTATDCRSCHAGFLLRHPDNGESCTNCHRH